MKSVWVIQAPGPGYLYISDIDGQFHWNAEVGFAMAFNSEGDAITMYNAVKALGPQFFAFEDLLNRECEFVEVTKEIT